MTLIFSLIFLITSVAASEYGFTVELIHRDSPKSPFYNPSETHYQRLANSLRRSINHNTTMLTDVAEAPIFNNRGTYMMKLSLGTPPFSVVGIVDTGSDTIWTQCEPCVKCYEQAEPMFNPSKSSTYEKIDCSSSICELKGHSSTCSADSKCVYKIIYANNAHSEGDLAVDTVTLESDSGLPMAFPRTVIGCGYDNAGPFNDKVSGLVGLGHGPASLVSQMGPASDGKFSYCLSPIGTYDSSTLNFGYKADVGGIGSVSTPIYFSDLWRLKTFYTLNLLAMSVGYNKMEFPKDIPSYTGNIIMDSGTSLTLFPRSFYYDFAEAIVDSMKLQRADDPNKLLEHCFASTSDDFAVPSVTAHFEGADVGLRHENLFARVSNEVVCLAFHTNNIPIYGNIAQTNFLIGYDMNTKSVTFKLADCANSK